MAALPSAGLLGPRTAQRLGDPEHRWRHRLRIGSCVVHSAAIPGDDGERDDDRGAMFAVRPLYPDVGSILRGRASARFASPGCWPDAANQMCGPRSAGSWRGQGRRTRHGGCNALNGMRPCPHRGSKPDRASERPFRRWGYPRSRCLPTRFNRLLRASSAPAEATVSAPVHTGPPLDIGQILDTRPRGIRNLLKSLASRTRFELLLPP